MTSFRVAVVGLVVGSCAAPPSGIADLTIRLSPAAFSATITEIAGEVHATDAKGLVGQGKVVFSVDVGAVEPAEATLDQFGAARFVWTCTTGCEAGGRVNAAWTVAGSTAAPIRLSKDVGFTGPAGAGGGSGGGSGGGTTTHETGASWKVTGSAPSSTDWATQATFDDSSWTPAVVIVAKKAGQDADSIWDVGPTVSSGSVKIYSRSTFTLTGTIVSASVKFACNDDMDVWLNGTRIINDTDGVTTYRTIPDVSARLVAGQNLVAASCGDVVLPEHGFWGVITVQTR